MFVRSLTVRTRWMIRSWRMWRSTWRRPMTSRLSAAFLLHSWPMGNQERPTRSYECQTTRHAVREFGCI